MTEAFVQHGTFDAIEEYTFGDAPGSVPSIWQIRFDGHYVRVNRAYAHWWVGCLYEDCEVYIKALPENDRHKRLIVQSAFELLKHHDCDGHGGTPEVLQS